MRSDDAKSPCLSRPVPHNSSHPENLCLHSAFLFIVTRLTTWLAMKNPGILIAVYRAIRTAAGVDNDGANKEAGFTTGFEQRTKKERFTRVSFLGKCLSCFVNTKERTDNRFLRCSDDKFGTSIGHSERFTIGFFDQWFAFRSLL